MMKYVILPPQEVPKQETVHHRPKTLGEMKMAFLNANNRKDWADDEEFPEAIIPVSRVFESRKKFAKALKLQQQYLDNREHERFLATLHTVPTQFDGILQSKCAAMALAFAKGPLGAAEYYSRRIELYNAIQDEEETQYIVDPRIQFEFLPLVDRSRSTPSP
jgi:hypothetical protein